MQGMIRLVRLLDTVRVGEVRWSAVVHPDQIARDRLLFRNARDRSRPKPYTPGEPTVLDGPVRQDSRRGVVDGPGSTQPSMRQSILTRIGDRFHELLASRRRIAGSSHRSVQILAFDRDESNARLTNPSRFLLPISPARAWVVTRPRSTPGRWRGSAPLQPPQAPTVGATFHFVRRNGPAPASGDVEPPESTS